VPLPDGPHLDRLLEAIAVEGRGHRALLAGDETAGVDALRESSRLYRESWELASRTAYGRLIGMLKAAVIAGDASSAAEYVRTQLLLPVETPPASYALAIAALVQDDDVTALAASSGMRSGSGPFIRAADAIEGLADHDAARYGAAIDAIVADFEGRADYLTGVPIADTAIMFERLAQTRGMAHRPLSPLLPASRG